MTIIIPVLISASVTSLIWVIVLLQHRMSSIERQLGEIEKWLAELESRKGKKHYSYNKTAAIWDSMAVIGRAKANVQAEDAFLNTALDILSVLYRNPGAYDPDRPSGTPLNYDPDRPAQGLRP